MQTARSKISEVEAEVAKLCDRNKHLERLVDTKELTIKELTERLEKRITGAHICIVLS